MELLVVFAILGLLAAIVPASMSKFAEAASYRETLHSMHSTLRYARQKAYLTGQSIEFYVDVEQRTYGISGEKIEKITSPSLVLRATTASQLSSDTIQRIVFLPDGGSSGGSVSISRSESAQGLRLRVDWLSGRVTIEQTE